MERKGGFLERLIIYELGGSESSSPSHPSAIYQPISKVRGVAGTQTFLPFRRSNGMTEYGAGGEGRERLERRVRKWKLQFQFKQFLPHLRPPESFPLLDTSVFFFFLLLLFNGEEGSAGLRIRIRYVHTEMEEGDEKGNKKGIFRERGQFLATRVKSNIRTTNENLATSIFRAFLTSFQFIYRAPRSVSYPNLFFSAKLIERSSFPLFKSPKNFLSLSTKMRNNESYRYEEERGFPVCVN